MNYKIISLLRTILILLIITVFLACEKNTGNGDTEPDDVEKIPMGTIEIEFRTPHGHLRLGCVIRAELTLATNAENLYKGNFIHSFNVSDEQKFYSIKLEPGSYYFQAALICICETNSCSAGSFPGGQYGMKYTADKFWITVDETTRVVPAFH